MTKPLASLPVDFLSELGDLEEAYLRSSDPIEQSGFHGGSVRWRAEREPILEAITADGDLLDVGCANGYLLECLVAWGRARGRTLMPYGLDQGARLIELARRRQPHLTDHFFVGNAWDWEPPRHFRYVYTLLDVVPAEYCAAFLRRLLADVVAPGGRLIAGAYGSRSRGTPPRDVGAELRAAGLAVVGSSEGGSGPITRFAWTDRAG
jgi:SAM-dependent methyltransferase